MRNDLSVRRATTILLVPDGVREHLQRIYSAYLRLQACAATIAAQPQFDLTLLPTLAEDQEVLTGHVTQYRDNISASLLDVFDSARSGGDAAVEFGSAMLPAAAIMDQGPGTEGFDNAVTTFRSLLWQLDRRLLGPADSLAARLAADNGAVSEFHNVIVDDDSRFKRAVEIVNISAPIQRLISQLEQSQAQIDDINSDIASSATSEIPSVLGFAMSIGEAVTAELSLGIMVVNMAIAVSQQSQEAEGQQHLWEQRYNELQQATAQYARTVENLENDRLQVAVLQTIAGQCMILRDSLEAALTALTALRDAIAQLRIGFDELATLELSPQPGYFTDQTQSAIDFWSTLRESCTSYLSAAI